MQFFKALFVVSCLWTINATCAEKLILKTYKATWTLHEEHADNEGGGYFGRYRNYHDMTGGRYIDLFPDYKFIIIDFCDICENEAVGHGTFKIHNSKLIFDYKQEPQKKFPNLHIRWGWQEKEGYVTGHIKVLLTDEQLNQLIKEPVSSDYIYQTSRYYEWRKIKDNLMHKLVVPDLNKNHDEQLEAESLFLGVHQVFETI